MPKLKSIGAPPSASRKPARASSCARKAFKRHILTSKPTQRKRHMRGTVRGLAGRRAKLRRMLPYN